VFEIHENSNSATIIIDERSICKPTSPTMFTPWSIPPTPPPSSPRPSHHPNASRSSFANPWPRNWFVPGTSLFSLPFVRAEPFNRPDIVPTKTVIPHWEQYEERLHDKLRFTWLGHAVRIRT
jgi:hypothetical protein